MRFAILTAALAATMLADAAHARLFYQTCGSTVAAPGGGSVWNINQDYFVPRHCHSCRYGLFSECKQAHTTSPACRHGHPIYGGYCTPYGPCRYRWRDHVYKVHCGARPLGCYHGPWRAEYCECCRPPLARLTHGCKHRGGAGMEEWRNLGMEESLVGCLAGGAVRHVEGYKLEVLGTIAADDAALLVDATLDEAARKASGLPPIAPESRLLPSFGVPRSNGQLPSPPTYDAVPQN